MGSTVSRAPPGTATSTPTAPGSTPTDSSTPEFLSASGYLPLPPVPRAIPAPGYLPLPPVPRAINEYYTPQPAQNMRSHPAQNMRSHPAQYYAPQPVQYMRSQPMQYQPEINKINISRRYGDYNVVCDCNINENTNKSEIADCRCRIYQ